MKMTKSFTKHLACYGKLVKTTVGLYKQVAEPAEPKIEANVSETAYQTTLGLTILMEMNYPIFTFELAAFFQEGTTAYFLVLLSLGERTEYPVKTSMIAREFTS